MTATVLRIDEGFACIQRETRDYRTFWTGTAELRGRSWALGNHCHESAAVARAYEIIRRAESIARTRVRMQRRIQG